METALVPSAWNIVQLIKLISAMIVAEACYRADAPSKLELLRLKGIVKPPFVEEPFQIGPVGDPHARPDREVRLIWPIRLAHGISTLTIIGRIMP
jgi:hypothetical protein